MAKVVWDSVGEKTYETGIEKGVLYPLGAEKNYENGVAWNGLISISESPSGAEPNPQYADNIKYLDIRSAEEFAATIEAFTYPKEFEACDGTASLGTGVTIGQQKRDMFGLAYKTLKGNDTDGIDHGYKLHLIYGGSAAPSEKGYQTINDSPEAITFSWEVTATPVQVQGYKPTAALTIDSTEVEAAKLTAIEEILYGTDLVEPRLPLPEEIATILTTP